MQTSRHVPASDLVGIVALPILLIGLYLPGALLGAESAETNAPVQPGFFIKKIESR